jgi:NAD(P)-dependent dehydrogenase (short-subunit alcohol dehydrogenase family)
LARDGAKIVVADLNERDAIETAQSIVAAGGTASAVHFDITEEDSVQAMFAFTTGTYGRLDGLHNNAADFRALESDSTALDISYETWDRTFEVDLKGYLRTIKHALPLLLAQGGGSIVNTSSAAAFAAMPNMPAYSAAKAGVAALTRHVAIAYGRQGIRCNNVAPGAVPTESATSLAKATGADDWWDHVRENIAYSNRGGKPEDLASMVALLMSDEGAWINGQSINVDGGWVMRS